MQVTLTILVLLGTASMLPSYSCATVARYVRIYQTVTDTNDGDSAINLAEIQVFVDGTNVAPNASYCMSSLFPDPYLPEYPYVINNCFDGVTTGDFDRG